MGKNQLKEQNLMSRSGRDKFQVKVNEVKCFLFVHISLSADRQNLVSPKSCVFLGFSPHLQSQSYGTVRQE